MPAAGNTISSRQGPQALWIEVMNRTLLDLDPPGLRGWLTWAKPKKVSPGNYHGTSSTNIYLYARAFLWLDSADFETVCDLLELDVPAVRKRLKSRGMQTYMHAPAFAQEAIRATIPGLYAWEHEALIRALDGQIQGQQTK